MKQESKRPLHLKPLTRIELYNIKVRDWRIPPKKRLLYETAIKIWKDNAQLQGWDVATYNKEAAKFNETHGYLLAKQDVKQSIKQQQPSQPYQHYINYPLIDSEAMQLTMSNYRRYRDQYNADAEEHNKNNQKNKKIQTIKLNSEAVFRVIMDWYVVRLIRRNTMLLSTGVPTSIKTNDPPKLSVNQRNLAHHRQEGIKRLGIVPKTVYNHVQRLIEAGVLIPTKFNGRNTAIKLQINPKILVLKDGKPPKNKNAQNQQINDRSRKNLLDNNDTTRTKNLRKEKKKGIANNSFELPSNDESNTQVYGPADSYKNTTEINNRETKNKNNFSAAEIINKFMGTLPQQPSVQPKQGTNPVSTEKLPQATTKYHKQSNKLRKMLLSTPQLAQKMANREFENYNSIRYEVLIKEVQHGNLTKDEFRQLMIQEFWKIASKLYKLRERGIVIGLWVKTINNYSTKMFISNNGFAFHKEAILKKMHELRWRVGMAHKLLRKYGYEPMIPTLYFDPLRRNKRDLGFYGTFSLWKTHIKYISDQKTDQKQREKAAKTRQTKTTAIRKAERAVSSFLKGKMSQEALLDYVQNNLHQDYLAQLPGLYEKPNKNLA